MPSTPTLSTTTRRRTLLALLVGSLGIMAGCTPAGNNSTTTPGPAPAAGKLVIAWAEWEPAKQMEVLCADFTKETNIPVEVQQIPWSDFETKVKTAWTGQSADYDLIIGDSQWLGKAATQGHYLDLTDWVKTNVPMKDLAPAAVKSYGDYEGKLYALPCMADATVFAYRRDLFDDPANQKAFQAKYKHPLETPKTWEEFQHVAEFFTQPDKKLSGAALFYAKSYDGVTMGFDQVLWSYGGKLSEGKKVEGVLNNADGLKALEFYVGLKKFTPAGSENYYFAECLRDFQEGKVAMAQSWFAFLPDLTNKEKNKFADQTGYFMVPKGPKGQFVSLGGQGISISAYSKQQENAKKFLAWFQKEDTQRKWGELGGLTANNKVSQLATYLETTPYNKVFADSVPYLKDFYNTPQYSELLQVSQDYLNQAVAGTMKPKEALDTVAKKQQAIMDESGK